MVTPQQIQDWIEQGLTGATARVSGDGQHFEALIVYADFTGKTRIQRHQMVYAALGDRMKSEIHALSMKTMTAEEAQSQH